MPWTLIGSASGRNAGGGKTTVVTTSTIAVQVGDYVVCNIGQETLTAPTQVTDGTSDLTLRATNNAAATYGQLWAWHVSPNAGSLNYTGNYPSGVTSPFICVYVFRPSGGTASFDVAREDGTGFNTGPLLTGNVTTNALSSDSIAFLGHQCANSTNSETINGTGITGAVELNGGAEYLAYLPFSTPFTGGGSAAMDAGSNRWVSSIIVFKILSTADDPKPRTNYLPNGFVEAWTPKWKVQARPPINAAILNVFVDGGGNNARDAVMANIRAQWWNAALNPPPLPRQPIKITQPFVPTIDAPPPLQRYQAQRLQSQWWAAALNPPPPPRQTRDLIIDNTPVGIVPENRGKWARVRSTIGRR